MMNRVSYIYIARTTHHEYDKLINQKRVYKIGSSYDPKNRCVGRIIHTIPFTARNQAFEFEFALHIHLHYYSLGSEYFELPNDQLDVLLECHTKEDLCDLFGIPHHTRHPIPIMYAKTGCDYGAAIHERFLSYRLAVPIDPHELARRPRRYSK